MDPLLEQKPNTRFLSSAGPAHLVAIYEFGEKAFYDSARIAEKRKGILEKFNKKIVENEKENKERRLIARKLRKVSKKDRALLEGNQIMRWGEPIRVYDSSLCVETVTKMKNYLNSLGYYAHKANYKTKTTGKDNKKVNITYNIKQGEPYVIDSLITYIPDWRLKELVGSFAEFSELRKGQVLKQRNLSAERDRIYELLVNRGYFEFSKDQIHFEIDSVTLSNKKLILRQIISSPTDKYYHKQYVVDSVIFITDAGGSQARNLPNEAYKGVIYNYGRFKYSPKILNWHNQLYPGLVYKRNSVLETQRQLSYLDNFKFINVNFDTVGTKFIAHIFTSPADKYQSSIEAGFSVTQALPGPFATVNLKNRNLFNGLEIMELNTFFKLEGNPGVASDAATYSSVQYGSELSITFPQFLSPLGRFYKKKIAHFNPRTRFGLALNRENRLNEYNRSQINANTSYIWKVQDHISYTFTPMILGYINADIDPQFQKSVLDELSATSNSFASTFRSSFVSAGAFQLTINSNYGLTKNSNFFQFSSEIGGNSLLLFGKEPFGDQLEYYQYVKAKVDLRRMHQVNPRTSVAMRVNIGVALPYGDNKALPYEKYFFGGGSNSNRAWKPRRLGPGSFGIPDDNGKIDYAREQLGDILFEGNVELRQKLSGFIDWALFMDIGNIWLLQSETIDPTLDPEGDDGVFRFDSFYKEIAVGSGVGIRMDMSFLIFRLDMGWKFVDPAQPRGKQWVANKIFPKPLSTGSFNIGIGYPF